MTTLSDHTVARNGSVTGDASLNPPLPDPDPVRILLIEDDPEDVLLTREYLTDCGLANRLTHTGSLAEANEMDPAPDCILLDLHLPDGHGLPSLQHVRQRWPDTAVVVLTGLNDTTAGAAAVSAGAQDYLAKEQVDGAVLGRSIRYAVQRQRARAAERQLRDTRMQTRENLRLQRGLLPKPLTTDPTLSVASSYQPGQPNTLLGGDFYDLVQEDDGTIHSVIGDVCGNGPDEAAIGVGLRVGWRTLTLAKVSKTDRMRLLEQVLVAERTDNGMFATACTIRISSDRSHVVIVSAGHPPPLIVTRDGAYPAPIRTHLALDMFPGRGRWQESTIPLPAGAGLLLYTDGAYEGFAR